MPVRDTPARQRSLREHNLALVMRQLATHPEPVSRAAIAATTGLTKATVSALVDELVAAGLASFAESTRAGVGRPATGVSLTGAHPAGLGMEINVDYLAACVIDLAGVVRHREVVQTDMRGRTPRRAWAALTGPARRARAAAAAQGLIVSSGIVALPGILAGNTLHVAPNLGWQTTKLPSALDGLPVGFGNEANLAAFGEMHASGLRSFIYVSGEIGIGAGIVVNSEVFAGTHGWAGELGHITVDPAGKPCRCGSVGCLEQYAGEDAIREAAALPPAARDGAAVSDGGAAVSDGGAAVSDGAAAVSDGAVGDSLLARALAGDAAMAAALDRAGSALGIALAGAMNLLDLPAVILGGHFAPLSAWMRPPIERELRLRVLTAQWSPPDIRPSLLGPDAAVIGAARLVNQSVVNNPAAYLADRRGRHPAPG